MNHPLAPDYETAPKQTLTWHPIPQTLERPYTLTISDGERTATHLIQTSDEMNDWNALIPALLRRMK